jgi:Cu+-exporting ATPase
LSVADAPSRREAAVRACTGCFHCGEPCPDDLLTKGGKVFCCHGCLTVHDLLVENGLGHFYDLNQRSGIRVLRSKPAADWAYLDAPEVQQRLLDFTDGRQSRVTFHVPAVHCIACVWLLENLFRLNPGIGCSQVNFGRREVAITFAAGKLKLSELVALLASIGYQPTLTLGELEKRAANPACKRQWLQMGIAGFAFGNIMLFSLPQYFGLDSFSGPAFRSLFGWLSLALALPVVTFSAADYWRSALLSLRQRVLTLDVPIALGLVAIYGQSAFEILSGTGEGYCDSLTGLIFLLLGGRVFQQKTHERLAFDRDYKSFFPLSVSRKGGAGGSPPAVRAKAESGMHEVKRPADEEHVSISQLQVGDRILIRNGELIPADARLVSGPAFIDYSFVTGESEPVAKQEGDYLYAGGQQIGAAIELETVKPVSQSYLTSLWNHAAFQKDQEDDFNTLTNRYSRRFTMIVIAVALGAALFWMLAGNLPRGLKAFTSVLIVACPCALALAAPFTLGTAQRWLARFGVFLKNALVLERMAGVDTVVFDKTGTLTSQGTSATRFVREADAFSLTPALARWEGKNRSLSPREGGAGDHTSDSGTSISNRPLVPLPRGEDSPNPSSPLEPPNRSRRREEAEGLANQLSPPRYLGGYESRVHGKGELTEDEARWIFSLTRHSTHPHAVRICESFGSRFFPEPVWSFLETPGCGLEGQVAGREIWLGSQAWLASRGARSAAFTPLHGATHANTPEDTAAMTDSSSKQPESRAPATGSTVHLAVDGRYRGAFVLSAALRPETNQLIRQLAGHYGLALLSGDNARERERFRTLFGAGAQLHFNQSPLDKLGFIRRLQESGKTVMMVGDGLNDAGALKQSDVGVAVVEKVGAFSPASDVILDAARVPQLFEVLSLARRSARIVRASFAISAAYNVLGVSIAAAGLLSPVVCAVLMPVSSVSVVLFACGVTTWAARKLTPKPETRNPQEVRSPKSETGVGSGAVRDSDFGVPSAFELPAADLPKA